MKSSSSNADRGPQTAVITGAAGAIGGAIARQLLADGWDVVGLDLQSGEHESVNWLTVDVTKSEEIIAAASTLDRCDLLINAAGFGDAAAAKELTPFQWDRVSMSALPEPFTHADPSIRCSLAPEASLSTLHPQRPPTPS